MTVHRIVPISRHHRETQRSPYRWRCIHCGDQWLTAPEPDDECETEDSA